MLCFLRCPSHFWVELCKLLDFWYIWEAFWLAELPVMDTLLLPSPPSTTSLTVSLCTSPLGATSLLSFDYSLDAILILIDFFFRMAP